MLFLDANMKATDDCLDAQAARLGAHSKRCNWNWLEGLKAPSASQLVTPHKPSPSYSTGLLTSDQGQDVADFSTILHSHSKVSAKKNSASSPPDPGWQPAMGEPEYTQWLYRWCNKPCDR